MSELKRKAPKQGKRDAKKTNPGGGTRKKRMLNLDDHELPDSFFDTPEESYVQSPGTDRKHRKRQGGARRDERQKRSQVDGDDAPAGALTSAQDHVSDPIWVAASPDAHGPSGIDSDVDGPHHGEDDGSSDSDSSDEYDLELETYAEAVNTNVALFESVHGRLFVVQGWDSSRNETTNSWFHLKFEILGTGDLSIACTCPRGTYGNCIHIRYFDSYRVEDKAGGVEDGECPIATLFSQRIVPGIGLHSLFSVQSTSVVELRGRAIVSHQGVARDQGVWKCSKDTSTSSCYHIKQSKMLLPVDFPNEIVAAANELGGEATVIKGAGVATEPRGPGTTVSYLPIHPPHWATLDTDPVLYLPLPEFRAPLMRHAAVYPQKFANIMHFTCLREPNYFEKGNREL
ncbi:hypothetical protein NMY22_g19133 [Coprinellus aureogranulatus]|nr:hypothetical protein NMY22_g19133 [Coprinellus aureogranulatus]